MGGQRLKIGVVAPGSRIGPEIAEQVMQIAARQFQDRAPEIFFHPQCFLSSDHFAGADNSRCEAFVEMANDDSFNAVWFARGGYGACRLLEGLLPQFSDNARAKQYLGYSDMGSILGALYCAGFPKLAHGPMPADVTREGGEVAIERALSFLVDGDISSVEKSISPAKQTAAFNITILSNLLGTPFQPDLTDHVLMLEEVSEQVYRIDRSLFHITSNPAIRTVAGIMLGRCTNIPPNDPDFGADEEQVARHWCKVSGIEYMGRADIGHDVENKIVPFGQLQTA
ncbi:MAG: LD-carboxypeptidase [Hyphomicrobiales bacterium]